MVFIVGLDRKPCKLKKENLLLLSAIKEIHFKSNQVYGAERIYTSDMPTGFRGFPIEVAERYEG